jgi:hypothetical protein
MEDVANQVNSLQVMDNNDDENHRRQEEEIVVVDQEARPATTTSDAGAAATGEAISMKRAVEVFCHFVITGCTVKDALLDIEGFMGKDKYEICDPIMFVVSRVHLEMLESFADEQDPDPAVQEGELENVCLQLKFIFCSFSHSYCILCICHSPRGSKVSSCVSR